MRFDVYRGKATVHYRPGKTVFVPPPSPRHLPPPTPSSLVHTTACARDRQHTILARSTVNLPSTPYSRASTSRRSTRQPSHLNSDHRPPDLYPMVDGGVQHDVYRGKATVCYRPGDTATIPPPTPGHRLPPTSSRPRSTRPHSSTDRQPTFLAPIDDESTYRLPREAHCPRSTLSQKRIVVETHYRRNAWYTGPIYKDLVLLRNHSRNSLTESLLTFSCWLLVNIQSSARSLFVPVMAV